MGLDDRPIAELLELKVNRRLIVKGRFAGRFIW
jgi:hypothetical protein